MSTHEIEEERQHDETHVTMWEQCAKKLCIKPVEVQAGPACAAGVKPDPVSARRRGGCTTVIGLSSIAD